jgi:hypothetical protein
MPVIFLPTPPRYLALPRLTILLPKTVFFPVKKQTLDIYLTSICSLSKAYNQILKTFANISTYRYREIASPKPLSTANI